MTKSKGNCLLAPVPIVHLSGALARAEAQGKVAFGSQKLEFFRKLEKGGYCQNLPVYIVASATGVDRMKQSQIKFQIGKAVLQGTLAGVVEPDRLGRHPDPGMRTDSTLERDSAWSVFWEVTGLSKIETPIEISKFSSLSGTARRKTPEGPELAHLGNL